MSMFTVDLVALDREGSVLVQGEIGPDEDLWAGVPVRLDGPLRVSLTASTVAEDGVMVRGSLKGAVQGECGRCLADVTSPFRVPVEWFFAPPDELAEEGEDDPETRRLAPTATRLELDEPIREEVLLSAPRYLLCSADCRGICARCGADQNRESCDCTEETGDPRWDVLRSSSKN